MSQEQLQNQQSPDQSAQSAEDERPFQDGPSNRFLFFSAIPSWLVSTIVHSILIIILMFMPLPDVTQEVVVVESPPEEEQEIEEIEEVEIEETEIPDFADAEPMEESEPVEMLTEFEEIQLDAAEFDASEMALELDAFSDISAPTAEFAMSMGSIGSTGVASRSTQAKKQMLREAGGTDASEAAVARALKWIAKHQLPDGSWSFDHTIGGEPFRQTPNAGDNADARNGATAIAILPFLGAGQTHLEGQYKENVLGGLNFLIRNQKAKSGGGSFMEPGGSFYSHGLAAIALCEAYAMTKDTNLIVPAQGSINFIVAAQDPVGGGWRYQFQQPGDTSVVGWQLMALKSAHMGYLEVPEATLKKSVNYLDSVSAENGAYYGYTGPARGRSTTSIGLLCRMYMGWQQDHPGLRKGIEYIAKAGPEVTKDANMYYNYYATQVMRHNGGDHWEKWNKVMRDFLVKEQARKGNAEGSWHFSHHWAERGGRLYNTALSTMVLEVYYRHMPIYKKTASDEEFKLE